MRVSDIEFVANTFGSHGGLAAGAVAGLYAAKRVFGPSLDAVGEHLRKTTERRLENLGRIATKAVALGGESDIYPHIRVTQRVLNDATLYDDDLQQTYVAGLLAGSRNEDGSDDRPVFYLSVIDALTAAQLSIFHGLYCAAEQALRERGVEEGGYFARVRVDVPDLNAQLGRLSPDDRREDRSALFALEHAGLIENIETWTDGPGIVVFRPTRVGALLFDWAYGFDDEEFRNFTRRERPDIGLPVLEFTTLQFELDTSPPPRPPL